MRLEDMRRYYNADISEAASPDTPMTHEQQMQSWAAAYMNQLNLNPCRLVPDRSESIVVNFRVAACASLLLLYSQFLHR